MNNVKITKEDIWKLHLLLTDDVNGIPGQWKVNENCSAQHTTKRRYYHRYIYPHPDLIPALMNEWIENYNKGFEVFNPLKEKMKGCVSGKVHMQNEKIREKFYDEILKLHCELFLKFIAIHPFFDGNKRVARILSYKPFTQNGVQFIEHPKDPWFEVVIFDSFKVNFIGRNKEYDCKEFEITGIDYKPMFNALKMISKR